MIRVRTLICLWAVSLASYVGTAHALLCTTSAGSANFGSYNPFSAVPTDSSATISVTCGNLLNLFVSYDILLSTGSSASFVGRTMANGSNHLAYNLFTDAAHSSVWGDGSGGSVPVSDGYLLLLLSATRNYTVHGRIPAGQNLPPGSYTDTIVVTVNY